jgi:hypothetical protein
MGRYPQMAKWLLLAICLALFVGCAKQTREFKERVDLDLAGQPVIYVDDWVRKGPPTVFVHPDVSPENPPSALFVPLRMLQPMDNARTISLNISRYAWQTWLQEKALPIIEFSDTMQLYSLESALAYARHRNAGLLVTGSVNHYFDGGTVGDSSVSMSMEIYDVENGTLMWSFGQAAAMQSGRVQDYLLFAVKMRLPSDPAAACVMACARDLAILVRSWAHNTPIPKEESIMDTFDNFNNPFRPKAF